MISIFDLAKRVKAGVRLLDRKVPNWRNTMRRHASTFNIKDGGCCILGTLEHHNGRMQVLNKRAALACSEHPSYSRGIDRLGLSSGRDYGFTIPYTAWSSETELQRAEQWQLLQDLWRAEFEV